MVFALTPVGPMNAFVIRVTNLFHLGAIMTKEKEEEAALTSMSATLTNTSARPKPIIPVVPMETASTNWVHTGVTVIRVLCPAVMGQIVKTSMNAASCNRV